MLGKAELSWRGSSLLHNPMHPAKVSGHVGVGLFYSADMA